MNRLLKIFHNNKNKQINKQPNYPSHPHKVTSLPSLLGRGWGRGFHPFLSHKVTSLPSLLGRGKGERL